jgi:ankyrin repeat protein
MHWAAKRGDYEILENLYNFGAILDIVSNCESRMLPIHWAASDGKLNSIRFLLEHRVDINAQDANGCTPLVISTQYNQIDTTIYLIKNGADLTLKDTNGDTALHWAAYKGFEELVGLLLHFMPNDLDSDDFFGQVSFFFFYN